MNKHLLALASTFLIGSAVYGQTSGIVKGKVVDANNNPLSSVTVSIGDKTVRTDHKGHFRLQGVAQDAVIRFTYLGYQTTSIDYVFSSTSPEVVLKPVVLVGNEQAIDEVEVFGERNKKPKGLEMITRMPLKPSDQIQSISVISNKVIQDQGILTLTDAVRNIPGVTLFGSYGGVKESLSTRGFRGIPVLKNGVRMDSQFQTASGVVDMQGVESIQMIKGSAAVTQGVITDLGNAGGVINVVTKTPNFTNSGEVGVRVGSWGQFRPTFDFQTVLDKKETVAFRMDGAYERNDSFRKGLSANRVYLNPSLAWKPTEKTTITLEGDYFNDNRTPVNSAVNLNPSQSINALYVIPNNKFLGMNSDNVNTEMKSFMGQINHELTDRWSIRASIATSSYQVDNLTTSASLVNDADKKFNTFSRKMSKSLRDDKNKTFQFDLIGKDLYTGKVKHLVQAGVDYRIADATTTSFGTKLSLLDSKIPLSKPDQAALAAGVIDVIDIHGDWANDLDQVSYVDSLGNKRTGKKVAFEAKTPVRNYYSSIGFMAQDVIEFNKYIKAVLGLRYSEITTKDFTSNGNKRESAWNPMAGIIVTPFENFNVFGSYTNSTSLRSAANPMVDGTKAGASTTEQFEGGIKSDWLDNRLRFNLTYFHIYTSDLTNAEYNDANQPTGLYFKAGDLVRDGIEAELNGRVLENLTVMLGYAYLDARYKNSPSYMNGSAPMNAPKHTANAWVQYVFNQGALRNLSLSAGVYYVGDRPVNEYSLTPQGHGEYYGEKPFNMPAYTTLNAQVGYKWRKFDAKVFVNNITNEIGLNSYFRGGFINQIDPRNAAVSLSYKF
ncbi:TonB-dependent receptor domain-containing protein [Sphingobacterium sp. NGMCC 1.201703]|uniref:TonB-dependent receptor n=1 Tax=unclassified Sphingobacterium TaxID=2609468 RepID=UPI000984190D|nr:TonB-dependent receptor [Sphingobacterium sp. CZ-UAM]